MTGLTAAYQFAPWLDVVGWVVNRWESETTETPLEDNNTDKSFGGRVGFTPLQGAQLLNFGLGGWWGPERDKNNRDNPWIVDFDVTWSPIARLLLAGELVYCGESDVSFRRVGVPFAALAVANRDARWLGLYALAHYDLKDRSRSGSSSNARASLPTRTSTGSISDATSKAASSAPCSS